MGFGLNLTVVKDFKLLSEIENRYSSGIYSAEQFIKEMHVGGTYFSISAHETAGVGPVYGPYTLTAITSPKFKSKYNGGDPYVFSGEKEGYITDLFWGATACFKDEGKAKEYQKEILSRKKDLFKFV